MLFNEEKSFTPPDEKNKNVKVLRIISLATFLRPLGERNFNVQKCTFIVLQSRILIVTVVHMQ
jgi:hypothetical protein